MNPVALDRQSVVPLYYQIQQQLLEQIRAGHWKVGDPVPSEQEISARLGVSRMTARQALKSLCSLGIVYSQRGKGTFVSGRKLEKDFRQLLSCSEEMQERGSQPRSTVLAFERAQPSAEVAAELQLKSEEQILRLRRIRLADAISVASRRRICLASFFRICFRGWTLPNPSTQRCRSSTEYKLITRTKSPKRALPRPRKRSFCAYVPRLPCSDSRGRPSCRMERPWST